MLVQSSVQGQSTFWQENDPKKVDLERDLTLGTSKNEFPYPVNIWHPSQPSQSCPMENLIRQQVQVRTAWHNEAHPLQWLDWTEQKIPMAPILDPIHSAIKEKLDQINNSKLSLANNTGFIRFCKRGMQPSSKALPKVKDVTWKGNWKVTETLTTI